MLSNAQAIIASIFKNERRGKALGLNGCIVAIGGMSGPALGGILINSFGWHSVFVPCIPVALAGAYYAWKMLPHNVKTDRKKFQIRLQRIYLFYNQSFCTAPCNFGRSQLGLGFCKNYCFRSYYINIRRVILF